MKLLFTLLASDVGVSFAGALGMKLRGTLKPGVVFPIISASKAGLEASVTAIETQFLAGGDAQAVVNAAISLDAIGAPVDFMLLAACDLAGWDVMAMTKAYLKARERFPDLEFRELSGRRSEGEDVIEKITAGTFVPSVQTEDWRVRIETGPLSFEELKERVASGEIPDDALALRPGAEDWLPVDRFIR